MKRLSKIVSCGEIIGGGVICGIFGMGGPAIPLSAILNVSSIVEPGGLAALIEAKSINQNYLNGKKSF